MLQTTLVALPITDDYQLTLENITYLRVIQDETNTERVIINGVPVINRVEEILPADGTKTLKLSLDIQFKPSLLPVSNPIRLVYIQYKKIINPCKKP